MSESFWLIARKEASVETMHAGHVSDSGVDELLAKYVKNARPGVKYRKLPYQAGCWRQVLAENGILE